MRLRISSLLVCVLLWATSAQAAFTWRTSKEGSTGANNPTSVTVTEPTGIASGDWEFALFSVSSACTVTTPSGWTKLGSSQTGAGYWIYYVTGGRGGSAPTLSFTMSGCTGSLGAEWHCLAVAGSNVTIDASTAGTASASGTNPHPPAATATQTTDESIIFGFNFASATTTWTAPAGYTVRSINGALDCVVASKDLSSSGTETPGAFTGDGTAGAIWSYTVLLEATGGGGPPGCKNGLLLMHAGCD